MTENSPAGHLQSQIVRATPEDFDRLANFLNVKNTIYRHLDWFGVLDWLGEQAFLIEQIEDDIQAFICATPENEETAWLRAFGVKKDLNLTPSWGKLLEVAIDILREKKVKRLAGLGLHPWFESLLSNANFINLQNVVVLEWKNKFPTIPSNDGKIKIRMMTSEDLPTVEHIDQCAFPSLWQNSLAGLTKAFELQGISTVAFYNDTIVGYQISTTMTIYGHLARLAVLPEYQRQGVAYALVYDLLEKFKERGLWRVTVNTQSNNTPSLKLYKKFGFDITGEEIPTYHYDL